MRHRKQREVGRLAAVALALCSMTVSLVAQASTPAAEVPAWQKAAGGAMSFEVASVRPDNGAFQSPSFALSADEWFRDPHGRFHADFALGTYISFAYKIWMTGEERNTMFANVPDWVRSQRFAIEATAPANATKDQYRLMMQALLRERFGLKLHMEQRERPVLEMTLVKPGKPGPRLTPHADDLPCDAKPRPDTFPSECYSYAARPDKDGMWITGSRATSMDLLADFVGDISGGAGETSRRVVDRTGLTGLWDFTLPAAQPGKAGAETATTGPTVLEALRDQLGIRLKPGRAMVALPVIDSVKRLEEN